MPFNCPTGTLANDRRIGYAESSRRRRTGPSTTTVTGPGGSVLPLGPAGAIDAQQVGYVWVLKDGAEYKMYYSANDATNTWRVALAVSSDARTWTKVPGKLAGGAILDVGPAGSFDFACAYQPTVVKERDQLYRMWYRGCVAPGPFGGPSRGDHRLRRVERRHHLGQDPPARPRRRGARAWARPAQFDSGGLTTPSVFLDGGGWNMYYAGFDTTGQFLSRPGAGAAVRARAALAVLLAALAGGARAQTMLDQEQRLIEIHSLLVALPALEAPGALAPLPAAPRPRGHHHPGHRRHHRRKDADHRLRPDPGLSAAEGGGGASARRGVARLRRPGLRPARGGQPGQLPHARPGARGRLDARSVRGRPPAPRRVGRLEEPGHRTGHPRQAEDVDPRGRFSRPGGGSTSAASP